MHKITGCLLKEQRDIPVYSAIQQMATDFPAISYLTPALRLQISLWVYHHQMDTGKMSSIIVVSTTSLQRKGELLISHLGNWGVKRARLGSLWTSNLSYKQRKWEMVPGDHNRLSCPEMVQLLPNHPSHAHSKTLPQIWAGGNHEWVKCFQPGARDLQNAADPTRGEEAAEQCQQSSSQISENGIKE